MGSAFYAAILSEAAHAYDTNTELRLLLERNAHRSRVGLRWLGAAHFRALRGDAPAVAAHFPSTGGDGDALAAFAAIGEDLRCSERAYTQLLARTVQTNEVARATPILAAMLTIAHAVRLPLRIFEIGSSAGLLLNFDRYRYTGEHWAWGEATSPLTLQNATVLGVPPYLDASLEIAERRGCDIHPLSAGSAVDCDTLLSFVWPDQTARFERLRAALEIARRYPPTIETADGIEWVRQAVQPRAGMATVVMHTVITEHMPQDLRERLRAGIRRVGETASAEAPFAWARMEPSGNAYETSVTLWPAREELFVARSDGHAQALQWSLRVA
jgi:hypothetical protein